jgi:DNA mismatch endonuclease, patch repair protein
MDVFDKDKRSWIMPRIQSKGTKPEISVCSMVYRLGYRFRKNSSKLPGNPDIVLKRHSKIIFVHGCFWHGHKNCKRSIRPSTNKEFWNNNLDANIDRDQKNQQILQTQGWHVLTVWQCELRKPETMLEKIKSFLES